MSDVIAWSNEVARLKAEIERLRSYAARADAYEKGAETTIRELRAEAMNATTLRTLLQDARTERDELLAFAKYVAEMDPGNPAPLFARARAAIAKAEGGK
jgi:predicted RNase H-like nuclease (RuvC/YqgF family)